ncbi:MAG TPA: urea ABC transporter permease subunit UrtB [Tepidisphaeraceae bacterium]|nr:urea ABC transporter permease subunit UrtB [Tepidisphaeraceae bacterium]
MMHMMLPMLAQTSWDEYKAIFLMQGFAGLSLFSVFLLMSLGLAIIFGQMRVINMAHGEFLTLGAYVTAIMSTFVMESFPDFMPYYFPLAVVGAFVAAFIVGYLVEFSLIRHLYNRPLDTLLATWGVSMVMQECFRQLFGARETSATLPDWLMGSWAPTEQIDIPLNGLLMLGMSIGMLLLVYLLLYRSRWGLRVRATTMNRAMAGAVGINTKRTDRVTFALGCGIAGIAGAGFTTIGSVSPTAGSAYIVDTFIVVVFGGAGSLIGTLISAFAIGQAQSILEFFLTGVLAKVFVLLAVIVILMMRPQGLFAQKVRR